MTAGEPSFQWFTSGMGRDPDGTGGSHYDYSDFWYYVLLTRLHLLRKKVSKGFGREETMEMLVLVIVNTVKCLWSLHITITEQALINKGHHNHPPSPCPCDSTMVQCRSTKEDDVASPYPEINIQIWENQNAIVKWSPWVHNIPPRKQWMIVPMKPGWKLIPMQSQAWPRWWIVWQVPAIEILEHMSFDLMMKLNKICIESFSYCIDDMQSSYYTWIAEKFPPQRDIFLVPRICSDLCSFMLGKIVKKKKLHSTALTWCPIVHHFV